MIAHQQKKVGTESLRSFRDRFKIAVTDDDIEKLPFVKFAEGSLRIFIIKRQRTTIGFSLPQRRMRTSFNVVLPPASFYEPTFNGSGDREFSTTMAFVQLLTRLMRNAEIVRHIVRSCRMKVAPSVRRACSVHLASKSVGPALSSGRCRPADVLPRR